VHLQYIHFEPKIEQVSHTCRARSQRSCECVWMVRTHFVGYCWERRRISINVSF
jgi:hypothetical protein